MFLAPPVMKDPSHNLWRIRRSALQRDVSGMSFDCHFLVARETAAQAVRCTKQLTTESCAGIKVLDTYIPIWEYIYAMARATTFSDAFNAVAEPKRREILEFLALHERP